MTEPDEEFTRNDNVDSQERQDKDIFGAPRDRERVDVTEEEDQQVEGELRNRDKSKSTEDEHIRRRNRLDDERDNAPDQATKRWLLEFDPVVPAFFLQCKRCGSLVIDAKRHARWHERIRR